MSDHSSLHFLAQRARNYFLRKMERGKELLFLGSQLYAQHVYRFLSHLVPAATL